MKRENQAFKEDRNLCEKPLLFPAFLRERIDFFRFTGYPSDLSKGANDAAFRDKDFDHAF
jgi:hypothetical protein